MIISLVLFISNAAFAYWAACQWLQLKKRCIDLKYRLDVAESKLASISGVEMLYKGTVNHAMERIGSVQDNVNTVQNKLIEEVNRLEARLFDLEGKE